MSYESTRAAQRTRVWIAAVGAVGAAIAIIPPMVTAFRSGPGFNQQGTGNTAISGSTVNSNNRTNITYVSMWVDGLRAMVGAKPLQSVLTINEENLVPEPGAIGTIVSNASLMGDATWSPEPSHINRFLSFYLHAEATGPDDKVGSVDATLARDGRDICTISLNTRTSPLGNGVRWGSSSCHDTLPANVTATYRARIKATDMSLIVVRLDRVDAVRK
jgi:hypothetical protein